MPTRSRRRVRKVERNSQNYHATSKKLWQIGIFFMKMVPFINMIQRQLPCPSVSNVLAIAVLLVKILDCSFCSMKITGNRLHLMRVHIVFNCNRDSQTTSGTTSLPQFEPSTNIHRNKLLYYLFQVLTSKGPSASSRNKQYITKSPSCLAASCCTGQI